MLILGQSVIGRRPAGLLILNYDSNIAAPEVFNMEIVPVFRKYLILELRPVQEGFEVLG